MNNAVSKPNETKAKVADTRDTSTSPLNRHSRESGNPECWTTAKIAELNRYRPSNVNPSNFPSEEFELYSVPVFPTGLPEVTTGKEIGSTKQAVSPGDVLLCKINPRINRVWRVKNKNFLTQIASSEWIVFRQPLLEGRYIQRYFQSLEFRTLLCSDVSGVGGSLTRARPKIVETYPIPLPPLAEQKIIADKLDELLAQVDTLQARLDAIPAILKRFRQSVLAAAVSGKLTEEWTNPAGRSSDWVKTTLGQQAAKVTSGSRGWAKFYSDCGAIFIRSQDINTDELSISDTAYVSLPNGAEGIRTQVAESDILITITGANVTKCARIKSNLGEAYVSQHVALVKLRDKTHAPFVELCLKATNLGRKQLTDMAYGGGKPGLNLQNIKDVKFKLPNLEEQTEIVRRVEQLLTYADQVEQQVKNAQARVNQLTQSILAKAFRGELTEQWRQDNPELISGDNSAAALLERIKAERTVAKPTKKTKGRKSDA